MSATELKRSLRKKRVHNYLDILHGKTNISAFSDQNDSNISAQNRSVNRNKTSVAPKRKTSILSEQNSSVEYDKSDSVEFDPDYSSSGTNTTNESSDGSGLFSKKIKVSDELLDVNNLRRASITLKRVPVPQVSTPVQLDKHVDLVGLLTAVDDDDDTNEYKRERQKQMLDRQMVLKSIDFEEGLEEFRSVAKSSPVVVSPAKKILKPKPAKKVPVKHDVTIRRRSERVQNRSIDLCIDSAESIERRRSSRLNGPVISYNDGEDSQPISVNSDNNPELKEIDENLNLESEDQEFIESLKDAINVPYASVNDFTICDSDKFIETLKTCYMFEDPTKVITSRITSMDFHPSEKKLLILVGDKYGNVALRDLTTYNGIQIKGHQYNANCVTFSLQNHAKFYSTSLDGTVRIGDINSNSSNLLYTSSVHTTWHHESDNTIYIAEGDGSVRLLDLRSPNNNPPSFHCHNRSVRTVQTNPLDENYFLTSSGTGYFGVWDVRHIKADKPKPIILETFTNALTSAFYSAKGSYVLTTGNDDTVRVFEVADNKSKIITRVSHDNHTGRWLSVFKAIWQPNREDCFYIGSMMKPRRIQAYTERGIPLREFRSDEMVTVNSVITVHPTKPIIVGGNASGKIHIYSPFRDLSDV